MFLRKTLKAVIIIPLLSCTLSCGAQPGGFLNKKMEVSSDLMELIQPYFNMEYKYCFYTHCAALLNFGHEFGKSPLYNITNIKYGSIEGNRTEYGIGFIFNTRVTGMPMPLGNYFGISYVRNYNPLQTEKIDSTGMVYKYSSKGYSIRWIFGREMYIAKNFVFDYNLTIGFSLGKLNYFNENKRSPDTILPFNSIFDFNNYNFRKGSDTNYNSFYFTPKIKIGYIF